MNTKIEIVEKYGEAFRDLINAKIWSSQKSIRQTLRLSKDEDWSFLCVSMDIIEDASTAINNFLNYGLNGPTKYNDTGEKYLRLYGILSSTYIQQEALLKLYQLMNVPPSIKKARELVNNLSIRSLRHKLCSHSTNYFDKNSNSIQAYVPIRIDLDNFNCTYAKDGRSHHKSIDLKETVDEHIMIMIEFLDRIIEKAINTLFKGQETNKNCIGFLDKLNDLRILKKGGFVQKLPNGRKLIVTMTEKNKRKGKQKIGCFYILTQMIPLGIDRSLWGILFINELTYVCNKLQRCAKLKIKFEKTIKS